MPYSTILSLTLTLSSLLYLPPLNVPHDHITHACFTHSLVQYDDGEGHHLTTGLYTILYYTTRSLTLTDLTLTHLLSMTSPLTSTHSLKQHDDGKSHHLTTGLDPDSYPSPLPSSTRCPPSPHHPSLLHSFIHSV